MNWPRDWPTNLLQLLRWIHLFSATAWIGTVLYFALIQDRFAAELDSAIRRRTLKTLTPLVLSAMRWSSLAAVGAGLADYTLILGSQGIAGRVFIFLAAWAAAWAGVAALLHVSAGGKALRDGRWLAVALTCWLAAVAFSGDFYMSRGGSSRAVALSVGGGLALLIFLNGWFLSEPAERRLLEAQELLSPAIRDRRMAFLVSRLNAWLVLPVLFFMAAASHFPLFETRGGWERVLSYASAR